MVCFWDDGDVGRIGGMAGGVLEGVFPVCRIHDHYVLVSSTNTEHAGRSI